MSDFLPTWGQLASIWLVSMLAVFSWFGIDLWRTRKQPPSV